MKTYNVKLSIDAKQDLRRYISYLVDHKKSKQAATNVLNDYIETRKI